MTETSPYWHVDTIVEIIWLANRELWSAAEGEKEEARKQLAETNGLLPFLDKLAVMYLEELATTGAHIDAGQLREKWLAWKDGADALSERWYSPVARAATGVLDLMAAHHVTLAARQIMPHAELQLAWDPVDPTGEPTYMRPESLLEATSREYHQK